MEASTTAADANRSNSGGAQATVVRFDLDLDGLSVPHTYNMIVEGVLAETGYFAIGSTLEKQGLLPGLVAGIKLLQRDESRHLRYGVYLLQRLISEDAGVWDVIQKRMDELLQIATGLIPEFWAAHGLAPDAEGPMGTRMDVFLDYATSQFGSRMQVLERARAQRLEQIESETVIE